MGSLILSRSFHVEQWQQTSQDDEEPEEQNDAMEVDDNPASDVAADQETTRDEAEEEEVDHEDDEEDEDAEDPADVAMIPMADMLNARVESENAKLFYEEKELKMITTKLIKAGEQIVSVIRVH